MAFVYLERDRDWTSVSLGMGGGMLPQRIKRRDIRAEGIRRGYRGAALTDFVEIVTGIDDERVAKVTARAGADANKAAEKAERKKR